MNFQIVDNSNIVKVHPYPIILCQNKSTFFYLNQTQRNTWYTASKSCFTMIELGKICSLACCVDSNSSFRIYVCYFEFTFITYKVCITFVYHTCKYPTILIANSISIIFLEHTCPYLCG